MQYHINIFSNVTDKNNATRELISNSIVVCKVENSFTYYVQKGGQKKINILFNIIYILFNINIIYYYYILYPR